MVEIVTIPFGTDDTGVIRRIKSDLRRRKLYRPDLMYRGINVDRAKLEEVCRHGTDRYRRLTAEEKDQLAEKYYDAHVETEEGFFAPDTIWLLPESCLSITLSTYCNGSALPAITVYKPEGLRIDFPGIDIHGKLVTEVPRRELENEDLAYIFMKGTKPIDSLVAVYRI